MTDSNPELNEIRELIATIQPYPESESHIQDPVLSWLEQTQASAAAHLNHPRLCLFKASHGFANSIGLPHELDYENYIQACLRGEGKLNRLALAANTDLRVYEMDPDSPSNVAESEQALTSSDLVRSMAYGMMAVEPGLDLMAAGAFGYGSRISAGALTALHLNQTPDDLTIARLLKAAKGSTGLDALALIGGYEIAALCGVIIAARLANCPVVLEGVQGHAACLILDAENPALTSHCRFADKLDLPLPAVHTDEPGLTLACAIQQIRTHVILNEGSKATPSGKLSQAV
jgi:nicotinate-nucleotide--dimethylbenzimidazole phosphoribosyltransferase